MTVWLLALLGAALLLLVAGLVVRRRAVARERRRAEAVGRLAERLEQSLGEVRAPAFPPFEPSAEIADVTRKFWPNLVRRAETTLL